MEKMNVMRFDRNKWNEVPVMDLIETDLVYCQGALIEVTGPPTVVNGQVNLPVRQCPATDEPIVLAVGSEWRNRAATAAVMDYTNADCRDFGDGTHMIAELEAGPGAIYSPRLSAQNLEEWCKNNLSRFESFFAANEAALDRGEIVKTEPWWAGSD
jgi:hypothetical protein